MPITSTGFGQPGLGVYRNAASSGAGQFNFGQSQAGPPAGYKFGSHQVGYVDPATGKSNYRQQLLKLPVKKTRGLYQQFLDKLGEPPALGGAAGSAAPTVTSGVDINRLQQDFLPSNVVRDYAQQQTEPHLLAAAAATDPNQYAGNQENFASAASGQVAGQMPGNMAQHLQNAAMVGAQIPIGADLKRFGFGTDLMGQQRKELLSLADVQARGWGDRLSDWSRRLQQGNQMTEMQRRMIENIG